MCNVIGTDEESINSILSVTRRIFHERHKNAEKEWQGMSTIDSIVKYYDL